MYSAYKLINQGDNIQPWGTPFLIWKSCCCSSCSISDSNCSFLTCIQISQEAGKVVCFSHLFKNFLQFIVIHTVKGFGIVNKAEVDVWTLLLFWWPNAKSLQSCPTLCDPIDGNPPGSIIPGILQARILEWVAISFSNAWKWKVQVKSLSCVRLLATPWTAAYQAPLSMDSPGKSTGVGCHCLLWWYNRCWQFDLWFLSLF